MKNKLVESEKQREPVSLAVCRDVIIESENTPYKMLGFRAEGYAKAILTAANVPFTKVGRQLVSHPTD